MLFDNGNNAFISWLFATFDNFVEVRGNIKKITFYSIHAAQSFCLVEL